VTDALTPLRTSLAERLASLRGTTPEALPAALLDIVVRRVALPGGDAFLVQPADWEALRHEEGAAGRPIPYWARSWPSGERLARAVAGDPPAAGARVLELGCGLSLPSIAAARAGATVLATDGSEDAVAFAAHGLALNEVQANVAHVDWAQHGDALAAQGPWDVVLAADLLYTRANVTTLLELVPRLLAPRGVLRLADPRRAGARDFLAAARARFHLWTQQDDDIALHTLSRR
jgi:predicted nicotinamide N-methyase